MMRIVANRLICRFSVANRTQNFFDMNPIYPYMGEKNFDIYNSERKKINVLEQYKKHQNRGNKLRDFVGKVIFNTKFAKYKRYSGGKVFRVDPETNLVIGLDSDFDDFVKMFRIQFLTDKNAKSEFKATLLKLIYRFKCKSQTQLIRLFRISIANSRSQELKSKLRGQVMQSALVQSILSKNKDANIEQIVQNAEEKQFQGLLKQLDEKIEKAEQGLMYKLNGVPRYLSKYDPDYGWMQQRKYIINQNYDRNIKIGHPSMVKINQVPNRSNLHDWSLKSRINRLYFLKRLQFLDKNKKDKQFQFDKQIPLNLRERDAIMNQIANRYKEQQAIQIPDLEEIYREVDAAIDKVNIKVSRGRLPAIKGQLRQQFVDRNPEVNEFLWESLSVQQIVCEQLYNQDSLKNIVVNDQTVKDVSPSALTQLSLSKIPINLYRHSQLESFGIFNDYRQKLGQNLLRVQEMDFEPHFDYFTIEQAKKRQKRLRKQHEWKAVDSTGKARRKTSYAQAKLVPGTGVVTINGEPIQDYFGETYHRVEALKPLIITETAGEFDVKLKIMGGGQKGQSQCMAYAIARALLKINPDFKRALYYFGLVGYDFRKKQPKKTNLYSARVRPPYVRR